MGKLLNRLFEDQLDGKFETKEEGLERAKELADLD
ncbi:hypothetical protein J3R74_002144 [Puniceicoccus vermicola]